jgi:ATP-binding cassette subfamily F protein uup
VSHDRAFLDNVVTSLIAYEGNSTWREYEGGIQDWLVQSRRNNKSLSDEATATSSNALIQPQPTVKADTQEVSKPAQQLKKKLGFKEQRELDALPLEIEKLEQEQKDITAVIEEGSIFSTDAKKANILLSRATQIESELLTLLERWEALSSKA